MTEEEKIKELKLKIAEVVIRIENNPWKGAKAQAQLKKDCEEKTRLITLINYLK